MTKQPLLEVKNLHIEFFDHARPETAVEDFHLLLYPGGGGRHRGGSQAPARA